MKIGILGYGKMGRVIERIAIERGHEITARIGRDDNMDMLLDCDAVIEFSSPESVIENLNYCFNNSLPVVCGTTGWDAVIEKVYSDVLSKNASLVHASNFSLGVNLFFELNEKLAQLMSGFENYDIALKEIHHVQKKDAPSGTAISIAHGIFKHTHYRNYHLGDSNEKESLGIEALRIDDVKGTHQVNYHSAVDQITLTHTAHSPGFQFS